MFEFDHEIEDRAPEVMAGLEMEHQELCFNICNVLFFLYNLNAEMRISAGWEDEEEYNDLVVERNEVQARLTALSERRTHLEDQIQEVASIQKDVTILGAMHESQECCLHRLDEMNEQLNAILNDSDPQLLNDAPVSPTEKAS